MKKILFLLPLCFVYFNAFSQNNPYLAMENLNNWKAIPFVDDFGDEVGIDHYALLGECTNTMILPTEPTIVKIKIIFILKKKRATLSSFSTMKIDFQPLKQNSTLFIQK